MPIDIKFSNAVHWHRSEKDIKKILGMIESGRKTFNNTKIEIF